MNQNCHHHDFLETSCAKLLAYTVGLGCACLQAAVTLQKSCKAVQHLTSIVLTHQSLLLLNVSWGAMRMTHCSADPPQGCCRLSHECGACDPVELV